MVDDEDVGEGLDGFEFETELLLDRGDEIGWRVGIARGLRRSDAHAGKLRFVRCPSQREIEVSGEARFVLDWPVENHKRKPSRKVLKRITSEGAHAQVFA